MPFEAVIDLSAIRGRADQVRATLLKLRDDYDLVRYEYTRRVAIAPGLIPHSHPVLTLNALSVEPRAVLSQYLHEQMHWYATWFSYAQTDAWRSIWSALEQRYPEPPRGFPEGGEDGDSSRLHLIVNWLEVEAVTSTLDRKQAVDVARNAPIYKSLYRIVLDDWNVLDELYRDAGLAPIRAATSLSAADLELAARTSEAPPGRSTWTSSASDELV